VFDVASVLSEKQSLSQPSFPFYSERLRKGNLPSPEHPDLKADF
jgi:hypothetical protein